MEESPVEIPEGQIHTVGKLKKYIKKASKYAPLKCLCFEQAIASKFMLNRRGISSTIYLGVKTNNTQQLEAHAWTRAGKLTITGNKGKENFTVISTFSTTN